MDSIRILKDRHVFLRKQKQCVACGWVFSPGVPMYYADCVRPRNRFKTIYMCMCCKTFFDAHYHTHWLDFILHADDYPVALWTGEDGIYFTYWKLFWSHRIRRIFAPTSRTMPDIPIRTNTAHVIQPTAFQYTRTVGERSRIMVRSNREDMRRVNPGQPVYINPADGTLTTVQTDNTNYVIGYVVSIDVTTNTAEVTTTLDIALQEIA